MHSHNQPATGSFTINDEVFKPDFDDPNEQSANCDDLFMVRTANHWMEQASSRPVPQMLFGKFWYEGELCILFADSNLGKSILAVQIGNSINTGIETEPFPIEAEIKQAD